MKRVSGTDETIVRVEIVVEPVEVQDPPLAVPVEIRDVAVAVRVPPDRRTECRLCHRSSNTLRVASDPEPLKPAGIRYQVASFLRVHGRALA